MTIVFDFDYTLYNTDLLIKAFRSAAARLGAPGGVVDTTAETVLQNPPYTVERHCQLIGDYASCDPELLHRYFYLAVGESFAYLYDDVEEALETLHNNDHTLLLLTFGDREFQREKIDASGIAHFFTQILYTEEENDKHNALPLAVEDEFVFVNDNPSENEWVRRHYPSTYVLQMMRPNAIYEPADDQEQVSSLEEMLDTVEQLNNGTIEQ